MKIRDNVSRNYLLSLANKDGAYGYVSAHEIINAPSAESKCFDGMTNGEVLQALFPNIDKGFSNVIDLNLWWNAPYKTSKKG